MAAQTHAIDIGGDALLPPWPTLIDLVAATDPSTWVVVGGLMVQLHAYRASIPRARTTRDVDIVLALETGGASFAAVATSLERIGFTPQIPTSSKAPLYRFIRQHPNASSEQVDVMVPDHPPKSRRPRYRQRPTFEVSAGEQAVRRRDTFIVTAASISITIQAPDVLGALVGKGAAFQVDSRDRQRHLEDAALLLATIEHVGELDTATLSANDRRRLRILATELRRPTQEAWAAMDSAIATTGRQNLERVSVAANL